jgi:predicted Rdx family selenoprotein
MTEILTFAETIIVTSGFLDTMGSSELYQDDEIIQKHSDSYQSPTTEKLKAVINKTVDPDDL